jgi:hypothetical protein
VPAAWLPQVPPGARNKMERPLDLAMWIDIYQPEITV